MLFLQLQLRVRLRQAEKDFREGTAFENAKKQGHQTGQPCTGLENGYTITFALDTRYARDIMKWILLCNVFYLYKKVQWQYKVCCIQCHFLLSDCLLPGETNAINRPLLVFTIIKTFFSMAFDQ